MATTPTPEQRHGRGLIVVIVLGLIFVALIALLVITTGKHRSDTATTQNETLTVLPLRIRIRTEPSAKAAVVTTASSGDKLMLLEDRGAWVRVQNDDGLNGWAERASLERTSERDRRLARYAAIRKLPPLTGKAGDPTPLYAGPGIFYPLVGELPAHSEVKIFTRDHDFYAVDYQNQVAYADIDALTLSVAGTPQLTVDTSHSGAAATETTESVPPMTASTESRAPIPPIEEPPPIAQEQPPVQSAHTDNGGVYSVVPPGGTQPEEIDRIAPRYPSAARAANISGAVVIRGIVRRDGTIDDVEVIKDLPYGLGDAARMAVEQWRFHPATYRGEPIDVYYTVTVNFRLR